MFHLSIFLLFCPFSGGENKEKYGWIVEEAMSSRHIGINSTQTHSMLLMMGDGSTSRDDRNWIFAHFFWWFQWVNEEYDHNLPFSNGKSCRWRFYVSPKKVRNTTDRLSNEIDQSSQLSIVVEVFRISNYSFRALDRSCPKLSFSTHSWCRTNSFYSCRIALQIRHIQ